MLAPVLQSSHTSFTRGGGGLGVLETVHIPSPTTRDEDLDQDTTISRSFRSGAKRTSSCTNMRSVSRGGTHRSDIKEPRLTLNQRFASLSKSAVPYQDANISARSDTSAQSKLSQVRILTSPLPTEQGDLPLTITPGNAMRSTRKSLLSNLSKRSVRSLLRRKSTKNKTLDRHQGSISLGGAKSKVLIPSATKDIEQGVLTSETNLETSDEEVFTSQKPRTDPEVVQYHTSPVNPEFQRQLPQEILLVHRPHLVIQSRGSSGGSDWSNPRKDRQVGSPGNTANADYFTKQHTPQLLDIDLDRPPREQPRTEFVPRPDKKSRRRATSSAPPRQSQTRQDGEGTQQFQSRIEAEAAAQNNARPHKAYKPGYSESDLTSQSEDETRRQNWEGRGVLALPAGALGTGSGFDLTPPTLDLSQVVPYEASAPTSSAVPLLTTSALSTNPSPLQYSSVSFSQSDMSLVVSPARPPTPTLPQYASSQSSHPISLDWDNYASDPQFQQDALGNLI